MRYRINPKNGDSLSQLGLGCMRFPRKGTALIQEQATALVARAIDHGVNYFDTAYVYPGSEEALGRALETLGSRDRVKIATKLPPYMCKSRADFDRIFSKQLERLRTDRIDYYLIHMLADTKAWERLKSMGLPEWLASKTASGEIINTGFSFHGGRDEFKRLIDAYAWDFCMVQYNYLDENNQASREGVLYAAGKGLPVFVMEPLRGGMLVNGLPKAAKALFSKERSLAGWGLAWLYNQPEVTMVLSGMSDIPQLDENAALSNDPPGCLTAKELDMYRAVVAELNSKVKIPCTGCNYCMPCPHGVDIPTCFLAYNESYTHGYKTGLTRYFMTTGALSIKQTNASLCKKCKKCERHCPQSIKISARLGDVTRRLEGLWYRPFFGLMRQITLRSK